MHGEILCYLLTRPNSSGWVVTNSFSRSISIPLNLASARFLSSRQSTTLGSTVNYPCRSMSVVQASTSCASFVSSEGHLPSRHQSSLCMPSTKWPADRSASIGSANDGTAGFPEEVRSHLWDIRKNYTSFRFGSEFRLILFTRFPLPAWWSSSIPHEMLSLVSSSDALRSHRSAARGDLIIPRKFTKTSALVGLRSLGQLHGTHSQHTWKIKICLLLFSVQNSKLTF